MTRDRSKLVISKDGIALCPDCSRETFELFDSAHAMNDTATFVLRRVETRFERKDPYGGYTWDTNWHVEARRVGCSNCKQRDPWPAYDLSADGAEVE
jgi:hypothetical protein